MLRDFTHCALVSCQTYTGNSNNLEMAHWGSNLFWYKMWYNDRSPYLCMKSAHLLEKLVKSFLLYGALLSKHVYYSNRWYQQEHVRKSPDAHVFNKRWFRSTNFFNRFFQISEFYNSRIKLKNLYTSRVWILVYQGWIVINFYCFIPNNIRANLSLTRARSSDITQTQQLRNASALKSRLTLIKANLQQNGTLAGASASFYFF